MVGRLMVDLSEEEKLKLVEGNLWFENLLKFVDEEEDRGVVRSRVTVGSKDMEVFGK